ncbi:MAG: helix-turn-helix domain-containing protein [Weissella hellenica]|uniref:helix-turn-helix domain-containing protein n=1 Tax=Weissella hellenica TaxID=46256 RepID=UPI003F9C0104
MDLGTKIKVQREKKNWSQQELADQIHISRQSISKWEQNKAIPSITNIVMMSNLFNISLDELMKDDEILVNKMDAQMKIARSLRNIMISVLIAFVLFIIIASFHVNISRMLH